MFQYYMARRTCVREQYYTGMRRYYCVRKDWTQCHAEKMYDFLTVFWQYLRIGQFVWARVLCGTRIGCRAAVECSGTIKKIHTRKIRWDQGPGIMAM